MKPKLSPWEKIVEAAKEFRPLRLSRQEVKMLASDDAICVTAENEADRRYMENLMNIKEGKSMVNALRAKRIKEL